ncbi:flagellar hook-basal body complex protein FliE [Abyssisolibacter fermentans]|uniref:flagellar hook-basal body complex protein FliE n=1 Tax=Abyssisolibacter fermentans TaxID=1766203 RepID=UPI000832028E|nr:flagellar hook-basal body complex protein FliE [Abyssisolibacter fermentans]
MNINTINKSNLIHSSFETINSNKKSDRGFGQYLNNALNKVNELQVEAQEYDRMLATGEIDNLHDATIASNKADIALQLTLTVRNKIIDAYKEIMRMQV